MNSEVRTPFTPRLVLGLCVVLVGVLFLLDNFGYFDVDEVWRFWPLILIAIGISRLLQTQGRGGGLFFVGLGLVFLAHNLRWFRFDVWELWPLFLVFLGLSMMWGAITGRHGDPRGSRRRQRAALGGIGAGPLGGAAPLSGTGPTSGTASATTFTAGASMDAGSWVKAAAVLGSSTRGSNSGDFRGGEATAVLGSCELDLRQATIAGGEAVLDVFAFWGGIDLRVPESWSVVVHATPLLGAINDKTRRPATPGKQLVVKGLVIMGGVDIQN